jgi:hypothetical protein
MKSVQLVVSSSILSGFAPPAAVSAGHAHTTARSPMVLMNLVRPTAAALCIYICTFHAPLLYLHVAPRVSAPPDSELLPVIYIYIFPSFRLFLPTLPSTLSLSVPVQTAVHNQSSARKLRVSGQRHITTSCMHTISLHRVDVGATLESFEPSGIERTSPPAFLSSAGLPFSSAAGTDSTC